MTWHGMNALDGRTLTDDQHLAQSVRDVLLTPLGSRVMRRDYGSALFDLLDAPQNAVTSMQLMAAAVIAIDRWEPRITLTRVSLTDPAAAQRVLHLRGSRTSDGAALSLAVPLERS